MFIQQSKLKIGDIVRLSNKPFQDAVVTWIGPGGMRDRNDTMHLARPYLQMFTFGVGESSIITHANIERFVVVIDATRMVELLHRNKKKKR